jgi:hypothetical protein
MPRADKIGCPECGIDMNHHADKIDYSAVGTTEPEFGGVLQEVHSCPGCGKSVTRIAS